MKVQEPSEIELKINNSDSNSTKIQDIKMYHKFGTGELSLGNNLSQKLPGENWEKQEIDPKQPLNISIKELNMGDEYAAKYDIMASQAISLKQGEQWEINYSYTDQVGDVKKTYNKVLNLYLDIDATNTNTSDATEVSAKGMISFKSDEEPSYPVNPDNPAQTISPMVPINPNGSELMITYASDLKFGEHSKLETSWDAYADKIKDPDNESDTKDIVPFVSVKDSRGTNRKGWKLTVKQDDDFRKGADILKGALLKFSGLHYSSGNNMPTAVAGDINLTNVAIVIASADAEHGSGITSLGFGKLQAEEVKDSDGNETQTLKTPGVNLTIPKGTIISAGTYTTSITYELIAGVE